LGVRTTVRPNLIVLTTDQHPTKNKDYMWVYGRSKIKSDGTLRKRLEESPETVKRLRQLEQTQTSFKQHRFESHPLRHSIEHYAKLLPEFGASQDRQNKEICQNIDNRACQDDEPKPLRWGEARKRENRKAGPNDDIRENDAAPLLLTPY
jgi:hypothetical protein